MDKKILFFIEKIEALYSQKKPLVSTLEALLKHEGIDFHQELLSEVLKKHNGTALSKMFLVSYTKYLRTFNVRNWEAIFEAIIHDSLSIRQLLYFTYHYLQVDFVKFFRHNDDLHKVLTVEHAVKTITGK